MSARVRGDGGFTTTEVVVALGVSAILGIITLFCVLGIQRSSAASIERSETASTARAALDSWKALLAVRESPVRDESERPAIESITTDTIVFYASIDNRTAAGEFLAPTRVRVTSDGGRLVEERTAATVPEDASPSYPAEPTTRRHLGDDATVEFRAYAADGRAIPLSDENLEGTSRARITRIEIRLTIVDDAGETHRFGGAP